MSEKMYAWLLRLYPAAFRERYGEEAVQLFRDRVRDEQAFLPRLRLWFDLLADLAVSLPGAHRAARMEFAGVVRWAGVPAFAVLEGGSPGPEAFCLGGVASLAAVAVFSALIGYTGGDRLMAGSVLRDVTLSAVPSSPSGSAGTRHAEVAAGGSGASGARAGRVSSGQSAGDVSAAGGSGAVDAAERQRVIDQVAANLKQFYFDREVAQKTADALLAHQRNGDDKAAAQGAAFADLLTRQMRAASGDMHLVMEYSERPLPVGPLAQTAEGEERFREAMLQQHCMIRRAEMLPHDIGYLKMDFFPDASVCGGEVRAAMASLNRSDAIIIDLRDNSGGLESTVSLVAGYLFDHPEYMYGPRGAPTAESWTRSPVAGNRLADKPVYVLTSRSTWSGAEQFSYNMKMLKRATLVGETTRGGAHAGVFHRIDDHFGMGIPEERSINPYGQADWEGVGVTPDVKVKAADALDTAVKLAEAKLQKK
jgi:hypothetical protein